jgi:ribosomal protein L37E
MSKKPVHSNCPRCGSKTFEHLSDYAHCSSCLYYEDHYEDLESAYHKAVRIAQEQNLIEEENLNQPEQAYELAS